MSDTGKFATLRHGLQAAARRRRRVRLTDALLLTAGATLAALYVGYYVDRAWNLVPAARLFLDLTALGVLAAAVRCWVWPALRRHEDAVDVALGVERRRSGRNDLVAALQFDDWLRSGRGSEYGSTSLLEAVVEQTAAGAEEFDPAAEPIERPTRGKRWAGAAVIVAVVLAVIIYPRHFAAWLDRALLGDAHYPSRTQIVSLHVNGAAVDFAGDATPRIVVAESRPITWQLIASGVLPEQATLALVDDQGSQATVELAAPAATDAAGTNGSERIYQAQGAAPIASLIVEAQAGDAYAEPFELVVRPMPLVTIALDVTLPAYAAGAMLPSPPPGRLSAGVLEGSSVALRVTCANKPLRDVRLKLAEKTWPLTPTDDERRTWRFDPADSPLAEVVEPAEFTVEAVDDDGFALPEPLRGSILLRPDQPPTVAAEVVTKYVLPAGKPSIAYQAGDDLGVRNLAVLRQVLRGDGGTESDRVEIPLDAAPSRMQLAGKFPLDLAPLELHKGDRVTIRLEARDRSGDPNRATAQSEPFTLEVTDEQGLYEAMAETDQRSARKMDEIIQKQLLMTGKVGPAVGPLVPAPRPSASGTPSAAPSSTTPPAAPTPTVPAPTATAPSSPSRGTQP
ncbi:MAG: hypothetical protein C0483_15070 [Pirellula sp.]|nr:hypothetical protein [Pirellula sp.]